MTLKGKAMAVKALAPLAFLCAACAIPAPAIAGDWTAEVTGAYQVTVPAEMEVGQDMQIVGSVDAGRTLSVATSRAESLKTADGVELPYSLEGGDFSVVAGDDRKDFEQPLRAQVTQDAAYSGTYTDLVTFKFDVRYSLTFNVNEGTLPEGVSATRELTYGSVFGELPDPTRTGYTFLGWYTQQDGGTQITADTVVDGSVSVVYAHWSAVTYTNTIYHVLVDGDGAVLCTLGTSTFDQQYGSSFVMDADKAWGAVPAGINSIPAQVRRGDAIYDMGSEFTQTAGVMDFTYLYKATEYSITYLNEGSGASPATYNVLDGAVFGEATQARYSFGGWYDVSGDISLAQMLDRPRDATCTICDRKDSGAYRLTFTRNTTKYSDNEVNAFEVQLWLPENGDYVYEGSLASLSFVNVVTGGATVKKAFTNPFPSNTYQIRVKINGTKADSSVCFDVYLEQGQSYYISYVATKATQDDSIMDDLVIARLTPRAFGINTDSIKDKLNGSENLETVLSGRTRGDRTFIASWQPYLYTVQFDANADNATGSMPDRTYMTGGTTTIPKNKFAREGYRFSGWATEPNGPKVYDDNAKYLQLAGVTGGVMTLYAVWAPITYAIAFDGGSSSTGTMNTVTVALGEGTTLPLNAFTKEGYTFKGWNTSADGTGALYADGANVPALSDVSGSTIVLYAQWEEATDAESGATDGAFATDSSEDSELAGDSDAAPDQPGDDFGSQDDDSVSDDTESDGADGECLPGDSQMGDSAESSVLSGEEDASSVGRAEEAGEALMDIVAEETGMGFDADVSPQEG